MHPGLARGQLMQVLGWPLNIGGILVEKSRRDARGITKAAGLECACSSNSE